MKLAKRKLRKKKIDAYKELAEKMESDDYDKKRSNKLKRTYRYGNKKDREQGRIAKDMTDIAGVIKETGDPYLGKLGMLRTKYKTKDDAKIAGVKFKAKGGSVKGYKAGGSVSRGQYSIQTKKVKFKGVF